MIKAGSKEKLLIVNILTCSFDTNRSANFIVKQDSKRIKRLEALMDYSFEMCSRFGEVYLSDDKNGCALILYPDKKSTIKTLLLDIKLILKTITISNISRALKRENAINAIHPKSKFSYLWFIGVNPKFENQGIGSKLLNEVIKDSASQNRPVYLETSTLQNLSWYKKFGFEIFHEMNFTYKLYFLRNT